jgi:hypothetical protein
MSILYDFALPALRRLTADRPFGIERVEKRRKAIVGVL